MRALIGWINRRKASLGNLFFYLLGIAAVWCIGEAGLGMLHYYNLNANSPATILEWSIKENQGNYALSAAYKFEYDRTIFFGNFLFDEPFRNPLGAENSIKELSAKSWEAWFDKDDPAYSSLAKALPWKLIIRAAITSAVFAYFFLMKNWLERRLSKSTQ